MVRKLYFVLLFTVLIVALSGCSTSTPTTSQIKEDMDCQPFLRHFFVEH